MQCFNCLVTRASLSGTAVVRQLRQLADAAVVKQQFSCSLSHAAFHMEANEDSLSHEAFLMLKLISIRDK